MIQNCLLSYLSTNWFHFQIYHAIGLRCSLAKVNHYIWIWTFQTESTIKHIYTFCKHVLMLSSMISNVIWIRDYEVLACVWQWLNLGADMVIVYVVFFNHLGVYKYVNWGIKGCKLFFGWVINRHCVGLEHGNHQLLRWESCRKRNTASYLQRPVRWPSPGELMAPPGELMTPTRWVDGPTRWVDDLH